MFIDNWINATKIKWSDLDMLIWTYDEAEVSQTLFPVIFGSFLHALTFSVVHFGCSGKVSISNIEKKVSWVVVRLTGIAWSAEDNVKTQKTTQVYLWVKV